jgi:uncharacterized protein YjiS (DUF1127 family)
MPSRILHLGKISRGAAPAPARARVARSLSVCLLEVIEGWAERRRQRRALLQLSDALLKDIGLARAQAEREAHKPFWRV